jgi:hypothetical protein
MKPLARFVTPVLLLIGLAAVIAAGRTAYAQTPTDPAIGSWTLNLAKSKYAPGPAPRSQTITITAVAKGVKVVSKGVDGKGKPTSTEFTAGFDGKDVSVLFNLIYDSVSQKRVDARSTEIVRKKAGKVVQTATRAVSADGKTMTITTNGVDDQGRTVSNVAVFDRM